MAHFIMKKVAIIIGVRPHYVKAAGLVNIFRQSNISPILLDVQQHYDSNLRKVYIESENLQPITISSPNSFYHYVPHNAVNEFARQVLEIGKWLNTDAGKEVDGIIVLGDANPALAGAIVANRMEIPCIHIEAGVRRVQKEKEHWNSLIADQLSDVRYCYTKKSLENLAKEGLETNSFFVGDILAKWTLDKAKCLINEEQEEYCLVSLHRPQNCTAIIFKNVCEALSAFNLKIIWIMHPRTYCYKPILKAFNNITILESQNHINALRLIKHAKILVTDSGGFVREGVLLEKQIVVCHEQGMWEDLVENKAIVRTDMDEDSIKNAIEKSKTIDKALGKHMFMCDGGVELFIKTLENYLENVH